MQAAGIERRQKTESDSELPPAEVEELEAQLMAVDFIAQFGAVRRAHEVIAESGPTPEWLGILVRGYANLSQCTQHQWSAISEVFAARSLLYAERLIEIGGDKPTATALWHRAYARALVGLHADALEDLEGVALPQVQLEPPAWVALIDPYCRWQRSELSELGEVNNALNPWALRLRFQLNANYRYSDWIYDAGVEHLQSFPTAYGVYADMAQFGHSLAATRTGSQYAPAAFARFSMVSLNALDNLPANIKDQLPTDLAKFRALAAEVNDPNPQDQFSPFPAYFGKQLVKAADDDMSPGLSWAALGTLIRDEVFVEAANYFAVSMVATEHSHAADVDNIVPTVGDHPYLPYLQSYRFNERQQPEERQQLAGEIELRDVTHRMGRICSLTWNAEVNGRKDVGRVAWQLLDRQLTAQGVIDSVYYSGPYWKPNNTGEAKAFASQLRELAPKSEIASRVQIEATPSPTAEQLEQWGNGVVRRSRCLADVGRKIRENGLS